MVRFLNSELVCEDLASGVGRELLEQMDEAAAYGGKLLLSFKGVVSMSSAMLGKLITLHKRCRDVGVELKPCDIPLDVYDVLRGGDPTA